MGEEEDARARVIAEMNARRKSRMFGLFVIPLMYAPALPLLRIALRNHPASARNKAYGAGILAALAHAGYVMSSDSSVL